MHAMSPYRGGEVGELACPRCRRKLPPLEVATCACGGIWVSAFAATEVLTPVERRADPVTRWWRVREPCPICGDKMILRGEEPGLFQGCDLHGYFIDADIIDHTSLARGIDHAAIDRKREDEGRVAAEREAREHEALRRARERAEIDRREAELARMTVTTAGTALPPVAEPDPRTTLAGLLAMALGDRGAQALLRYIRELEERISELERRQR